MGIFSLFSSYDKKWDKIIKMNADDVVQVNIIKRFFIPDKISTEKYVQNFEALGTMEQYHAYDINWLRNLGQPIVCTKSLPFAANPINRGMGLPNWFYATYPDVIKWMSNKNRLGSINESKMKQLFNSGEIFRILIDKYKSEGNKLECSL